MFKKTISNSKRGFTLVEITVVVAIIVILTSIAIMAGSSAKAVARDNQRKTDIRLLQVKIEAYREQYGKYPVSIDGTGGTGTTGNDLSKTGSSVSGFALPQDPINSGVYSYQYIPLKFTGNDCGASYYLSTTLENNSTAQSAVVDASLVPCAGGNLPATTTKTYDVTSPSSFKQ